MRLQIVAAIPTQRLTQTELKASPLSLSNPHICDLIQCCVKKVKSVDFWCVPNVTFLSVRSSCGCPTNRMLLFFCACCTFCTLRSFARRATFSSLRDCEAVRSHLHMLLGVNALLDTQLQIFRVQNAIGYAIWITPVPLE